MKASDIHSYILSLTEPMSISEIKALIGHQFPVRLTSPEWGKPVLKTDYLKITNINIHADISSKPELDITMTLIYCDFFLDDQLIYNAWHGLISIQNGIKDYIAESNKANSE